VPDEVATVAFQNKAVVYDILFQAEVETLRTIAADPTYPGRSALAVRHTWART
jgi:hypothetical protein